MPEERILPDTRSRLGALWFGLLGGPAIWVLQMSFQYMLVRWTCSLGREWPEHLVTIGALLVCAYAGYMAASVWRDVRRDMPDDAGGPIPRARFMAALGVSISAMFFVLIFAQGLPALFINSCQ